MNLDVLTLQTFLAVAETGSFTRAASQVGRTQSAVSQQMARLEHGLDTRLFVRSRRLTLTPQGETFLGYARQIFALYREALDHFKAPALEGEVRFGLPEDFASVLLSDVLAEFARIHPRILLNIECDLTLPLYERFLRHEFDLVLVKMNRPEDFPCGQEVWSEPLEWIGTRTMREPPAPLPLVLSPPPCVYRARALHALEQAGYSWRHVFSSSSYASTLAAVRAGMGITVLPRTMIPETLNVLESPALPPLSDTHVSLLKHRGDNFAINSFEAFMLQTLRHG